MKELPKTYDPRQTEKKIYEMWEKGGYFKGVIDKSKKPFSIVMPPPNVTGQLHMGHAMDSTLQDILTRYKRMQGYAALWLPGVDHAGISTQVKVEEVLRKEEGKTRYDLGREEFLKRVWDWKNKYGDRIVEQQKSLGVSCDWDRSRFTLDDTCAKAVREAFCELYDKGLIYRGSRIINWCPHCRTALSDAEVEYKDMPGSFWHIRYPIEDSDEEFIIATTRPETMLGDTGVAVHPDDERYKHLVGKNAILPLVGRKLPIVADEYVELGFGTGAVKMTPCHDPNDYEVGLRHNLEQIQCIDEDAKIINGGKYNGMDRYEARKAIVADLEEQGYLVKVEPYSHNVGCCYRCGNVVEPLISPQWFVKMKPLAEEAIKVVKDGRIKFVPERFTKTYLNWMENVHDWCISRQLWWGHQIPAWYCDDCGHITVSREDAAECEHCHSKNIHREEDVLDTWFSSGLWPFSTMGWPDKTEELDFWYPTSVMITGYDIIFFWVARMIFSGMEQMKKEPFKTVFIHGLVRDSQGRKMSKSLGNGIDPLEIADKYGADALRFNLITGNSPGNDMRFYVEKCEAMRNFCNKIWNAFRLVKGWEVDAQAEQPRAAAEAIEWFDSKLSATIAELDDLFSKFRISEALMAVYRLFWDEFSSWYLEAVKPAWQTPVDAKTLAAVERHFDALLRLLHPFMPFITEELWQNLAERREGESIMYAAEPRGQEPDAGVLEKMETVKAIVNGVRGVRAKRNIAPKEALELHVVGDQTVPWPELIGKLGNVSAIANVGEADATAAKFIAGTTTYEVPLADMIDTEAERAKLAKEIDYLNGFKASIEKKLSNERFVAKAPAAVVEGERKKLADAEAKIARLTDSLQALS